VARSPGAHPARRLGHGCLPYTEAVTVFYELQGEGAREALEAFSLKLEAAGLSSELLESATEPDLFLLLCRSREGLPPFDAPAAAKVWQFRAVR
jgi:hypothetical protein